MMRYWEIQTEANAFKTRKLFNRLSQLKEPDYNLILYTASANPFKQKAEFWVKANNLDPLNLNGIVTDIHEIDSVNLQMELYENMKGSSLSIAYHIDNDFAESEVIARMISRDLLQLDVSITDKANEIFEFYSKVEDSKRLVADNSRFRIVRYKNKLQGLDYQPVLQK